MNKLPTCNQYLLDIFTSAKLKAAANIKDPAQRAKQEKFYTDVKEDECTFSRPVMKDGKWSVDITCVARGWKYEGLRYNTGSLPALVAPKSNYTIAVEKLRNQTITGLYFAVDKETLHLVLQPHSNIWEALRMTGYEFSPNEFSVTNYNSRDEVKVADGHIDIRNTVVAGRIYITNVARYQTSAPIPEESPVTSAKIEFEGKVEEMVGTPAEGVQLEPADHPEAVIAPVEEEKPFVDFKALGDGALEAVAKAQTEEEEIQALLDAEAKEEVVEEKPVQQQKSKRK